MDKLFTALILVTLTALLISCSNQEFGIFYYIENEREQKDESLENELSILSMVKEGTFYYIAAGGRIFRRHETDNEWDSVKFPSQAEYCTALTVFQNELYAGFLEDTGTFRFYKGTASLDPGWQRITDSRVDDKQVIRAEVITGAAEQLFVITFDNDLYSLYWSDDGTNYNDGILDQGDMLRNVTYNSTALSEQFWAITDSKIFIHMGTQVTVPTPFNSVPAVLPDARGGYRGIYYSATHGLYYVSTLEGIVVSSPDGTTWTESDTQTVSGRDVPFWFISEVADFPTESNVIVGSMGYGFFEMPDGDVANLDRMSEFIATELYFSWITGFFVDYDGPTPLVFAYTAGSGLWRNEYAFPGEWGEDWTWE